MTFKDYFAKSSGLKNKQPKPGLKIGVQKRHMNPIGRDVSSHSKHPGRFVPHMHRTINKNQKVEGLLLKTNGRAVLNDAEIKQIEDEFGVKYSSTTPKKLGNTGISLRFDPTLNKAVLEK